MTDPTKPALDLRPIWEPSLIAQLEDSPFLHALANYPRQPRGVRTRINSWFFSQRMALAKRIAGRSWPSEW